MTILKQHVFCRLQLYAPSKLETTIIYRFSKHCIIRSADRYDLNDCEERNVDKLIFVGLGGALGAIARFWLGGWISSKFPMQFPLGTFVINVTGSFIIGFVMTLMSQQLTIHPYWRLLIAVGFIGAYTTFSTFEYETMKLLEEGNILSAALNVGLSVIIGFIAVWLGVVAARKFHLPHEIMLNLQTMLAKLSRTDSENGD